MNSNVGTNSIGKQNSTAMAAKIISLVICVGGFITLIYFITKSFKKVCPEDATFDTTLNACARTCLGNEKFNPKTGNCECPPKTKSTPGSHDCAERVCDANETKCGDICVPDNFDLKTDKHQQCCLAITYSNNQNLCCPSDEVVGSVSKSCEPCPQGAKACYGICYKLKTGEKIGDYECANPDSSIPFCKPEAKDPSGNCCHTTVNGEPVKDDYGSCCPFDPDIDQNRYGSENGQCYITCGGVDNKCYTDTHYCVDTKDNTGSVTHQQCVPRTDTSCAEANFGAAASLNPKQPNIAPHKKKRTVCFNDYLNYGSWCYPDNEKKNTIQNSSVINVRKDYDGNCTASDCFKQLKTDLIDTEVQWASYGSTTSTCSINYKCNLSPCPKQQSTDGRSEVEDCPFEASDFLVDSYGNPVTPCIRDTQNQYTGEVCPTLQDNTQTYWTGAGCESEHDYAFRFGKPQVGGALNAAKGKSPILNKGVDPDFYKEGSNIVYDAYSWNSTSSCEKLYYNKFGAYTRKDGEPNSLRPSFGEIKDCKNSHTHFICTNRKDDNSGPNTFSISHKFDTPIKNTFISYTDGVVITDGYLGWRNNDYNTTASITDWLKTLTNPEEVVGFLEVISPLSPTNNKPNTTHIVLRRIPPPKSLKSPIYIPPLHAYNNSIITSKGPDIDGNPDSNKQWAQQEINPRAWDIYDTWLNKQRLTYYWKQVKNNKSIPDPPPTLVKEVYKLNTTVTCGSVLKSPPGITWDPKDLKKCTQASDIHGNNCEYQTQVNWNNDNNLCKLSTAYINNSETGEIGFGKDEYVSSDCRIRTSPDPKHYPDGSYVWNGKSLAHISWLCVPKAGKYPKVIPVPNGTPNSSVNYDYVAKYCNLGFPISQCAEGKIIGDGTLVKGDVGHYVRQWASGKNLTAPTGATTDPSTDVFPQDGFYATMDVNRLKAQPDFVAAWDGAFHNRKVKASLNQISWDKDYKHNVSQKSPCQNTIRNVGGCANYSYAHYQTNNGQGGPAPAPTCLPCTQSNGIFYIPADRADLSADVAPDRERINLTDSMTTNTTGSAQDLHSYRGFNTGNSCNIVPQKFDSGEWVSSFKKHYNVINSRTRDPNTLQFQAAGIVSDIRKVPEIRGSIIKISSFQQQSCTDNNHLGDLYPLGGYLSNESFDDAMKVYSKCKRNFDITDRGVISKDIGIIEVKVADKGDNTYFFLVTSGGRKTPSKTPPSEITYSIHLSYTLNKNGELQPQPDNSGKLEITNIWDLTNLLLPNNKKLYSDIYINEPGKTIQDKDYDFTSQIPTTPVNLPGATTKLDCGRNTYNKFDTPPCSATDAQNFSACGGSQGISNGPRQAPCIQMLTGTYDSQKSPCKATCIPLVTGATCDFPNPEDQSDCDKSSAGANKCKFQDAPITKQTTCNFQTKNPACSACVSSAANENKDNKHCFPGNSLFASSCVGGNGQLARVFQGGCPGFGNQSVCNTAPHASFQKKVLPSFFEAKSERPPIGEARWGGSLTAGIPSWNNNTLLPNPAYRPDFRTSFDMSYQEEVDNSNSNKLDMLVYTKDNNVTVFDSENDLDSGSTWLSYQKSSAPAPPITMPGDIAINVYDGNNEWNSDTQFQQPPIIPSGGKGVYGVGGLPQFNGYKAPTMTRLNNNKFEEVPLPTLTSKQMMSPSSNWDNGLWGIKPNFQLKSPPVGSSITFDNSDSQIRGDIDGDPAYFSSHLFATKSLPPVDNTTRVKPKSQSPPS